MDEYPHDLIEFEERFATEEACLGYLAALRWPGGFVCPTCGHTDAWTTKRGLWHCRGCGRHTSVTAGTIFHRSRKPLRPPGEYLKTALLYHMPGFRPNEHYFREMKRYGILPPDFDEANDPIDVFAVEQKCWQSLWHRPEK